MLKQVFHYPVDAWAALLVVSVFIAQLGSYFFVSNVWLLILISTVLLPFRLSVVAYNHNHIHAPTFVSPALNRLFEILMFFQTGTTPFSGVLNHMLGHHATYFKPEQDTLVWTRADGSTMSKHEFSIKAAWRHYTSCFSLRRKYKTVYRHFLIYSVICLMLLAALVIYDPLAALIMFIVPMLMMIYVLKMAAYSHHSGLPMGEDHLASRTNTGKFYNWLTWNAGYHAAHHFKPALHWSLLPAYHAELAPKIPQELQGEGWGEQLARSRMKPKSA